MSVQKALMTVIAKPNAKIRLAITSVLAYFFLTIFCFFILTVIPH